MTTVRLLRAALVVTLLVGGFDAAAHATPITSVVVYGDSLSDNGNLFAATGFPPPPYFQGRFSDGPVAVELLAASLGVPLHDFAVGGATTGIGGSDGGSPTNPGVIPIPGMQVQFAATQAALGPLLDGLFVVWGGPNDIFHPSPLDLTPQDVIDRAVTDLVGLVVALQGLGAHNILVPGMPDLGLTPAYQSQAALYSPLTAAFNAALQVSLPVGAIYFDSAGLLQSIVADPAAYGLSNVTTPCFDGITVCASPGEYLFWDDLHFTTAVHAIVARGFEDALATPEPATFLLLASGLALCCAARTRRRSTQGHKG